MSEPNTKPSFSIILAYSMLIIGTILYSSRVTERTLYDRFIVGFEGVLLKTSDQGRSLGFYRDKLDFPPIYDVSKGDKKIVGFSLGGDRRLVLSPDAFSGRDTSVLLKVRNGIEGLYTKLSKRLGQNGITLPEPTKSSSLPPESISELKTKTYGKEFVVSDPDGNRLIFYTPKRRSTTRIGEDGP